MPSRFLERTIRTPIALILLALWAPAVAHAQTRIADDSIHAGKTLFTWRDAVLAGGFVGLTIGMFPLDRSTAIEFRDSTSQASKFLKSGSRVAEYIGDPGSLVIGVGLYGVGRITKWRTVEDLGLHGTEAIVLGGATTSLLKGVLGRARPRIVGDTVPDSFGVFRGFQHGNSYMSFPSGHATAAFAAAATVTSEAQRFWPGHSRLVAPAMYGGATLVGLSRMYNNAHWASDVALGAAIGTFSGIKVVRYSHGHSDNFVDRWLLGAQVIAAPNGAAAIGWSFEPGHFAHPDADSTRRDHRERGTPLSHVPGMPERVTSGLRPDA
jgi:membrane-associated phospholipid phosphatase